MVHTISLSADLRAQAKATLRNVVVSFLQDSEHKHKSPGVIVDLSLDHIKRQDPSHGLWGMNTFSYSRRRTLKDSFLRLDWDGCVAEAARLAVAAAAPSGPSASSHGAIVS